MKKLIVYFLLGFTALLFGQQSYELQNQMNEKQREFNKLFAEYRGEESKLSSLELQIKDAQRAIDVSNEELTKSEKNFATAQEFQKFRPDVSIEKERKDLVDKREIHQHTIDRKKSVEEKLASQQLKVSTIYQNLKTIETDYNLLADQSAKLQVEEIKKDLQQEKTVEVEAEFSCGQLSISKCKEAAYESAKRDAAEKGTSALVESITIVENSKISKDEIKSSIQAVVTDVEVLDKGMIGESGYFYKIRATVIGQPPKGISNLVAPKRLKWGITPVVEPVIKTLDRNKTPEIEKVVPKKPEPVIKEKKEELEPEKEIKKPVKEETAAKKKSGNFYIGYSLFNEEHRVFGEEVVERIKAQASSLAIGYRFVAPFRAVLSFGVINEQEREAEDDSKPLQEDNMRVLQYGTIGVEYVLKSFLIGLHTGPITMKDNGYKYAGNCTYWKVGYIRPIFTSSEVEAGFTAGKIRWDSIDGESVHNDDVGREIMGGFYLGLNYHF